MWISSDSVAIVTATFAGPIGAIIVAQWREAVREKRARQMKIFRTLMATRRRAVTQEHVEAINLIEVDFYGHRDVEVAWQNYLTHLNSWTSPQRMTLAEDRVFEQKRAEMLAKLLFPIAKNLGFTLSEIDIKNGGYAPDAWRIGDERLVGVQEYILKMGRGEAGLPIFPLPQASNNPPSAEQPKNDD